MNYTNFQLYKPANATEAKLYWSTQDNIDWVKAKEAIKDYNLPVVVYNHLTGKILEVNPPLDLIIPTGKSILITDLKQVQAIFTAAEYARMRLEVAEDILNFDYKPGFPETYTKE